VVQSTTGGGVITVGSLPEYTMPEGVKFFSHKRIWNKKVSTIGMDWEDSTEY